MKKEDRTEGREGGEEENILRDINRKNKKE